MYLPDTINPKAKPKADIVHRASGFLAVAARAACGVRRSKVVADYKKFERRVVRKHIVRERSAALAREAKIRDSFTCKVCGFNFGDLYGEIGHGVAEAHHRVPLKSARAKKPTKVADLVTVCANCHRMLHRQSDSTPDGVAALRQRVEKMRAAAS